MRQSTGVRGAGTLSYMAPEHLESIHNPSTEKSDVYSFAIVVWVILTGEEPYASELWCHDMPKFAKDYQMQHILLQHVIAAI